MSYQDVLKSLPPEVSESIKIEVEEIDDSTFNDDTGVAIAERQLNEDEDSLIRA